MAEKKFIKGLFKDTGHIDQPEGTWRHARNMVLSEKDGSISNEGGTSLNGYIGNSSQYGIGNQDFQAVGALEVNKDRVILFVTDVVNSIPFNGIYPRSEIGIWEKGTYTPIFNPNIDPGAGGKITNDLKFSIDYPIEGTFKIDSKGDLIVYWTDDLNPPRAFNVDRQQRESLSITELYGISSLNIDHIDLLNLFPYSGPVPHINIDDQGTHQNCVIEGGGLLTGVYYLALAYVDDDLVATNFLTVSNPIPIVDEYDYTMPSNKKDGAKHGSQTTKAIKWEISNLNTNYKYLRPIVIRSKGDAQEAFKLNDVTFTTNTTSIVYSGLETQATGSPSEVIIDTIAYDTAKTIQQLDNVLYLGNTTGSKDIGYQKYANNIKLRARVDVIEDFDVFYAGVDNLETGWGTRPVNRMDINGVSLPVGEGFITDNTKSYRYVPNIFSKKGYMRGEVYAFYIAFIMKDGSMSYAYHIPGREYVYNREIENPNTALNINYGDLWEDIERVSPEYGKLFHWMDTYTWNISQGSYNLNTTMGMNYWENATETYPDTDNFEVWDGASGFVGSLKGEKVRHHHFPSNRHLDMKTVLDDTLCRTDKTIGSSTGLEPWSGRMAMLDTTSGATASNDWYACCNNWTRNKFNGSPADAMSLCGNYGQASGGYTNDPAMQNALWSNNRFTADQEMQVRVRWFVVHRQKDSDDPNDDVCTRLRRNIMGTTTTWNQNCDSPNINWTGCGHAGTNCGSGATGQNWVGWNSQGWTGFITLNAGDTIWLESQKVTSSDSSMYQCGYDYYGQSCVSPWGFSYIEFEVESAAAEVPIEDLHDAKINHNVQRLGFDLEDIKIPQSMADKVQGFRIYYANRKHSDRTVLGQSIVIPAMYKKEIIGICDEASNNVDEASQVLSTLQAAPEAFYSMDAYTKYWEQYEEMYFNIENGGPSNPVQINDGTGGTFHSAYNVFSFYDFYLLRTKNSLAPATHIEIQYYVQNLAWNGPGLDQDKKMVTTLTDPGNDDPLIVKEVWGWDEEQNCYPQKMNSAFFAGVNYVTPSQRTQPRLLGQKAKTYLMGDTIFEGKDLGFGGKLFNEFGQSTIAFRLMDKHAIGSYKVRSYPTSTMIGYFADIYGTGSQEASDWGGYGVAGSGFPRLVNTLDSNGEFIGANGGPHAWHGQRSMNALVNLKAFKTDVYKSIDSQELVWTGFEVLGDDLDNYVFDNSGMNGTGNTIDTHPDGIYGGDTFICRYGVTSSLGPSNAGQSAEPEKAIHYHIVESTDNINFRNVEDKDSSYFPNTILKDILRNAGPKDFNHVDNLRYNKNYSELNNIRPAFPLPLRDVVQDDFPTRTHRSAKHDTTSIIDNYRVFLANQFKDLPKNRGDLWKLSSFNNLLYFHMEQSLFAAQGKQTMSMGDGSEAFVGSGDIFAQEPNEMVQTKGGFGGTQSQYAAITTRYGYFFVDKDSRKVFLMQDQLQEISSLGMDEWFKDNLKFQLEDFFYTSECNMDNPIKGMGYTSTYDPKFKRILLTKREFAPTQNLINGFNVTGGTFVNGNFLGVIRFNKIRCIYQIWAEPDCPTYCPPVWLDLEFDCNSPYFDCKGWTISYYPELGIWGSFHDYIPYLYFSTSTNFYSLTDQYQRPAYVPNVTTLITHNGTTYGNAGIFEHNSRENHGILYQEYTQNVTGNISEELWLSDTVIHYPFELEYIHNEFKAEDTLLHSISYTLETYNQENITVLENGFTSFFIYNTFQMSGENVLEYLVNTRRVGNEWKINHFRDMAATAVDTSNYYMSPNANIIGGINTGTITTSSTNNMFVYDGMLKTINPAYIDLGKNWNLQKKFIDKWIGIRLIYDNISNNSLNLYSTNVAVRKMYR